MAEMGQNTHRLSVEWSRIEPQEGAFDEAAMARYRVLLQGLRRRGMEPMVTLHHFTTPLWMAEKGGWANPLIVDRFHRFVRHTVEGLQDVVSLWCTINEPAVYATEAYVVGIHAPGRSNLVQAMAVLKHMLLAHGAAYQAIHEIQSDAAVGLAKNIRLFDPANPRSLGDRLAARLLDHAFNELSLRSLESGLAFPLGLGGKGRDLAGSLDFIGLNYYTRDLVTLDLRARGDLFMRRFATPGAEISDAGPQGTYGEVYPEGLYRALQRVARYDKPIYVTEAGLPDADDDQRPRFLLTHLAQVHRAIREGLPVRGFYHWSQLDNFEWSEGWALRFGLVACDERTGERIMRPSGHLYAAICRQNAITDHMVRAHAPEAWDQVFDA